MPIKRYPALALDGLSVIFVPPGVDSFGFSLVSAVTVGMYVRGLGWVSSSSARVADFTFLSIFWDVGGCYEYRDSWRVDEDYFSCVNATVVF